MKTKLNKAILILVASTAFSSVHAEQSLLDRVSAALNERHQVRTPTAVAAVRG
jgi:hypothetical protein